MKKYPDFWSVIFGQGSQGFFFGFFVIGLISAAAMMCILAVGRDKSSESTPTAWSWRFFLVNNALRIFSTVILLFLFVRLTYEYFDERLMLVLSIGIGFGFPKLAHIARKWGLFTTSKISERLTELLKQKEKQASNDTQ